MLFLCLFICSCGTNNTTENSDNQEIIEEIEQLETETKVLDDAKQEIQEKTKELDSLLNVLGNF